MCCTFYCLRRYNQTCFWLLEAALLILCPSLVPVYRMHSLVCLWKCWLLGQGHDFSCISPWVCARLLSNSFLVPFPSFSPPPGVCILLVLQVPMQFLKPPVGECRAASAHLLYCCLSQSYEICFHEWPFPAGNDLSALRDMMIAKTPGFVPDLWESDNTGALSLSIFPALEK